MWGTMRSGRKLSSGVRLLRHLLCIHDCIINIRHETAKSLNAVEPDVGIRKHVFFVDHRRLQSLDGEQVRPWFKTSISAHPNSGMAEQSKLPTDAELDASHVHGYAETEL